MACFRIVSRYMTALLLTLSIAKSFTGTKPIAYYEPMAYGRFVDEGMQDIGYSPEGSARLKEEKAEHSSSG